MTSLSFLRVAIIDVLYLYVHSTNYNRAIIIEHLINYYYYYYVVVVVAAAAAVVVVVVAVTSRTNEMFYGC